MIPELRFCCLSSSSVFGNACLVTRGSSSVLVDCGIPLRRLERTLNEVGCDPATLSAILISHEHIDHTRALALKHPFACRHRIPVYGTQSFWDCWNGRSTVIPPELIRVIESGQTLQIGDLEVTAFAKRHDSVDPIGFLISGGNRRLGVVTDLGEVTPNIIKLLRGVDYLVFESNHDLDMERESGRPWFLVRRVLGPEGHLSNEQAAAALSQIVTSETQVIVLGHLSCDCNEPSLARSVVDRALSRLGWSGQVVVAPPGEPTATLPETPAASVW